MYFKGILILTEQSKLLHKKRARIHLTFSNNYYNAIFKITTLKDGIS